MPLDYEFELLDRVPDLVINLKHTLKISRLNGLAFGVDHSKLFLNRVATIVRFHDSPHLELTSLVSLVQTAQDDTITNAEFTSISSRLNA